MLRILQREHVTNKEALWQNVWAIMGKEGLENLILTGLTEGKRSSRKQQVTYLINKWRNKDKK